MRALDRDNLQGLWAAVATPWDESGKLDCGILAENCRRLASENVDGIYTTDADGEFYAVELEEFSLLAKAFSQAMEAVGVDAAMGVSWFSTQGVIDRIRIAVDAGIPNVHVALPLFMPLADGDVDRFFEDLARQIPDARWIHYAHSSSLPVLSGRDYSRLAECYRDQLIGTKIAAAFDVSSLTEILSNAPVLAHLVGDPTLSIGMLLGASGNCSYWVNSLPRWSRQYMDACMVGRWQEAVACHKKLWLWELQHVAPLERAGHRHGIVSRALGMVSGFLVEGGETRAPYYPISPELLSRLKSDFEMYWVDELRQESFRNINIK